MSILVVKHQQELLNVPAPPPPPFQESMTVLAKFGHPFSREDADSVDTLRYTWQRVQGHAAEVQSLLRSVEPHFRGELLRNLAQFRRDVGQFCEDYRGQGPMAPGLEPREASDRMQIFQVGTES